MYILGANTLRIYIFKMFLIIRLDISIGSTDSIKDSNSKGGIKIVSVRGPYQLLQCGHPSTKDWQLNGISKAQLQTIASIIYGLLILIEIIL